MQFINIVVHSVEDMNFRVHLQFDFTKLCLDDYLDVSLRHNAGKKWADGLNDSRSQYSVESIGCHYSTPETAATERQSIMAFPLLQKKIGQFCKSAA